MRSAAYELGTWLSTVGTSTVEPSGAEGETRILVGHVDAAALRSRRAELLTAYIRRAADERQVDCAMMRIEIERQRRGIQVTRAWLRSKTERRSRRPG